MSLRLSAVSQEPMLFARISGRQSSPVSVLHKSIAGRYRPVRVADGPITARYRFMENASWNDASARELHMWPRKEAGHAH